MSRTGLCARYDVVVINRKVVAAIIRRPWLWGEALRAAVALAPTGWWRRRPFLPLPEPGYIAWRVHTAYGEATARVTPSDAMSYLEWRKRQRSQG